MKYNEDLPVSDHVSKNTVWLTLVQWSHPLVFVPLGLAGFFFIIFILVELLVAPEPILAPALLKQKVPVLVGISNFLVALCNFSVMYFFPMWFQTVALTSASTAGGSILLVLVPALTACRFAPTSKQHLHVYRVFIRRVGECIAFAILLTQFGTRWMMHRTGKYKLINLIFGLFPFVGITLITLMREDSGPLQMWLSIVSDTLYSVVLITPFQIPLGFGNAVVLQTMLST